MDVKTEHLGRPSFYDSTPGYDDSMALEPRHHDEKNLSAAEAQPLIDMVFNADTNTTDDRDKVRNQSEYNSDHEDIARKDNKGAFALEDVVIPAHSDETFGKASPDSISTTPSASAENRGNLLKSNKDSLPLTSEKKVSGSMQDAHDIDEGIGAAQHENIPGYPEKITDQRELYQPPVTSEVPDKDQSQDSDNKGNNYDRRKKIFYENHDVKPVAGTIEEKKSNAPAGNRHQDIKADKAKDSTKVIPRVQPPMAQPLSVKNEPLSRGVTRQDEKDRRVTYINSPAAPEVKIGQVDVFIEAPHKAKTHKSPARRPSPSLSSRYYLRRP